MNIDCHLNPFDVFYVFVFNGYELPFDVVFIGWLYIYIIYIINEI
jgi:hypothetical protein